MMLESAASFGYLFERPISIWSQVSVANICNDLIGILVLVRKYPCCNS